MKWYVWALIGVAAVGGALYYFRDKIKAAFAGEAGAEGAAGAAADQEYEDVSGAGGEGGSSPEGTGSDTGQGEGREEAEEEAEEEYSEDEIGSETIEDIQDERGAGAEGDGTAGGGTTYKPGKGPSTKAPDGTVWQLQSSVKGDILGFVGATTTGKAVK